MSVGMLITFAAAWAISGLATTTDPALAAAQIGEGKYLTSLGAAIYTSPLKWVIMFLPLAFVFGFGAAINRLSAASAQLVFYVFAATMGLSISWIFMVFIVRSGVEVCMVRQKLNVARLQIHIEENAGFGGNLFVSIELHDAQPSENSPNDRKS